MNLNKNIYSEGISTVDKNTLEPIATFIDDQVKLITAPVEINGIPPELQDILNNKLTELRKSKISLVSRDFMTRKVYDLQNEKLLSQMDNIIKLINSNDIAMDQIGSQLHRGSDPISNKISNNTDKNTNNGVNLDYLISDILKLPKLTNKSSSIDNNIPNETVNPEQTQSLKEYDILRTELINYCHVLLEGQKQLFELKVQVDKIDTLKNAIIETSMLNTQNDNVNNGVQNSDDLVSNHNDITLSQYLKNYFKALNEELLELSYTIEEKIKSTDENDKLVLKNILDEISVSKKNFSSLFSD